MALFSDGFESGDTSAWDATWGGGAVNTVFHSGSWSFRSQAAYEEVLKTLPANYADCFLRFYARFAAKPTAGNNIVYGIIYDTTGTHDVTAGIYSDDGATTQWHLKIDDGAQQWLSAIDTIVVDTWYSVEIERNVTGAVNLWVDGTNKISQSGTVTNNSASIHCGEDYCSAGAITLYIDDVVADTSYIGPLATFPYTGTVLTCLWKP